jgi:hypothetical protein
MGQRQGGHPVSVTALLSTLEASGVRLSRCEGDLKYQPRPGVSIAPYREQIITNKPALIALLRLQEEIVAAATAAQSAFDRQRYDALWERWYALQDQGASE